MAAFSSVGAALTATPARRAIPHVAAAEHGSPIAARSMASAVGAAENTVALASLVPCVALGRRQIRSNRASKNKVHQRKIAVARMVQESGSGNVAAVTESVSDVLVGRERLCGAWQHILESDLPQERKTAFVEELVNSSGDESMGPVRFERVIHGQKKDSALVLYIPDVDFTGVLAAPLFVGLAYEEYEVWRCFLDPGDKRTVFVQLAEKIEAWLTDRIDAGRRVILVGQSFGGLLALQLALRLGRKLKGVSMVNPATSFGRAAGRSLARGSANLAEQSRAASEVLRSFAGDVVPFALLGALGEADDLSSAALKATAGKLETRAATAGMLAGSLPFRLRAWLRDGAEVVESELRRPVDRTPLPPVLLACSSNDRLLPSEAERQRLKNLLQPRCSNSVQLEVVDLKDAGHEPLHSGDFDFPLMLKNSPICTPRRPKDYVNDYKFPTLQQVEEGSAGVERFASVVSPVFLSMDAEGQRHFGLGNLPTPADIDGRPVLMVGNHQLLGLDLGPLVREYLCEKGVIMRGLAHPFVFARRDDTQGEQRGGSQDLVQWGAVPVSPRNIFKLLQNGEAVLLFPGGVKEACHGPGEAYKLFWQEETDFVRVAARFNAVVVPFGGVGCADNVNILAAAGDIFPNFSQKPPAGTDGALSSRSESLRSPPSFPLVAPQLQLASSDQGGFGDRYYASFGRPVDLKDLNPKDKEACQAVYDELKKAATDEIDWLLENRTRDPFRNFLLRQVYERTAAADPTYVKRIEDGPLKGSAVRSYGRRAPSFQLS